MSEVCAANVAEPQRDRSPRVRSRITNDVLRRAHGWTSEGRRVRDLYRSYTAALGNPNDPGTQAEVLRAAELIVAAEAARTAYLAKPADPTMLDQVIRLENLSARALRRIGIDPHRQASDSSFALALPDELP